MGVLKTVATFGLVRSGSGAGDDRTITLNIVRGSVLDFAAPSSSSSSQPPRIGAIVNAANEGCLGGGGVDGAITTAGGDALRQDRNALPILGGRTSKHRSGAAIRCRTGDAVLTGPAPNQSNYGALQVPYVIHAVGPAYFQYENFAVPDLLLRSAYQHSLERCCTTTTGDADDTNSGRSTITDVGFSLLSAGIFRGDRTLEEILTISLTAIRDWVRHGIDDLGKEEEEEEKEDDEDTVTTSTSQPQQNDDDDNDEKGKGGEEEEESHSSPKKDVEQEEEIANDEENMEPHCDTTPTDTTATIETMPDPPGDYTSRKSLLVPTKTTTTLPPTPAKPAAAGVVLASSPTSTISGRRELQTITLCGFNSKEVQLLVQVCRAILGNTDADTDMNVDSDTDATDNAGSPASSKRPRSP